jgi:glycerophosphoryl diester phosphodiesterase
MRKLLCAVVIVCGMAADAGAFDLQGHRGARGLAPENTLEGFRVALAIGVTTLETDLGVTKDGVLVLTHDRMLNPDITRAADGRWVEAPGPAVRSLTLSELKGYDVGRIKPETKYAQQFSAQTPADGARIPTLAELFDLAKATGNTVRFNIETKISPDQPGDTVDPETFAELVVKGVREAGLANRVTVQSFDWRTLKAVQARGPEIATVCLTAPNSVRDRTTNGVRRPSPWLAGLDPIDVGGSMPRLVNAAGCATWSPRFAELTAALVEEAQGMGLKVVPWTINDTAEMARAIDMRVDGLITDYPDRARSVLASRGMPLP